MQLWRALEDHPALWRQVAELIADFTAEKNPGNDALVDQAIRFWRRHADRRGALLNVLTALDRHNRGGVPWDRFALMTGGLISRVDAL